MFILRNWWKTHHRGIVTDSNGGFYLKDGSMLSPDAAYLTPSALKTVPAKEMTTGFPHVCPDFVIELQSTTDRPRLVREKMQEWIANGAQLGWLINPERQSVMIYRPTGAVETRTGIDSITGEGPVAGFTLDLGFVWNPFRPE